MAAPNGTVWGSIYGDYARLGFYTSVTTNTDTTYSGTVQVWYWSKYGTSDSANTFYFDDLSSAGSASTSRGKVSINVTVNSGGGWSTSNQALIYTYSFSYTKGTSASTRYLYAKLTTIETVSGNQVLANTTLTVPAATPKYYLDLNGYLDGATANNISGYGTADIYINGSKVSTGATDYYTQWPKGTTYKIVPTAATGYKYNGIASGSAALEGTINGDTSVRLSFSTLSYTLTINPNGGSYINSSGASATANTTKAFTYFHNYIAISSKNEDAGITSPTSDTGVPSGYYISQPKRTGYRFGGWYWGSTLIGSFAFSAGAMYGLENPRQNLTVTASWNANPYTVVYNGNGATSGSTANSSHVYGTAKALTANGYAKTGYRFLGWSTSSTATSATYIDEQSVLNLTSVYNGIVTLYAVWAVNTYTVAYNGNGHTSGSTASSSHTYGVAKALTANGFARAFTVTFNPNGGTCSTASAARSATFSGWATSSTGSVVYSDKQSVSNLTATHGATVTLYAKWSSITIGTLPTPARTGYKFLGWYTAASGGTQVSSSTTINAATTVYAQWSPITYTIKYDGNGATSGSTASSTHTYNSAKALTTNGFKRIGYEFLGWATSKTGGVAYVDKQSVTNLANTQDAVVTLYAVWKLVSSTYVKVNGQYKVGVVYVKKDGVYQQGLLYTKQDNSYKV